jgi:hypothetical protein
MEQGIQTMKTKDWSLNLEDIYYEQNPLELLQSAIDAVQNTAPGCYVNLVTPGSLGSPEQGFMPDLLRRLQKENIMVKDIQYIDECGCGGYVTRVYR